MQLGGDGNDAIDGNQGNDTALMGAGDDRFTWDPGDGSATHHGTQYSRREAAPPVGPPARAAGQSWMTHVVARAAVEAVHAAAAEEHVVAGAAEQRVRARTADQHVGAVAAIDREPDRIGRETRGLDHVVARERVDRQRVRGAASAWPRRPSPDSPLTVALPVDSRRR